MTKGISVRSRSESIAKHRVRDSLLHKYNALLFRGSENRANESHRLETVISKRCQLKEHLCRSSLPRNVLASRQSSLFMPTIESCHTINSVPPKPRTSKIISSNSMHSRSVSPTITLPRSTSRTASTYSRTVEI